MDEASFGARIVDYVLSQGLGVVFGAVVFYLWFHDKRRTEQRLADLLHERKADRDEVLRMLGRLEAHQGKAEPLLRQLVIEASLSPKRRRLDPVLATIAEEGELHNELAADGTIQRSVGARSMARERD